MHAPELPPCDHRPPQYTGPSAAEILRLRKEFLNPAIFLYYKKPLMLVEGKMQYVWDETGRRYLDALGGIVTISVGHCHPDVVEATRRQNDLLQHSTTIYLHPQIAEYAENTPKRWPQRCRVTSRSAILSIPDQKQMTSPFSWHASTPEITTWLHYATPTMAATFPGWA